MGENLTRETLNDHLVDGQLRPGAPISLRHNGHRWPLIRIPSESQDPKCSFRTA
jgi:hypothetical protein